MKEMLELNYVTTVEPRMK